MVNLSSSKWFGPLFFSQNWTNSENILENSDFSLNFDNFYRFFKCHSILAEKQRTKQTNYNSLSLSTSLDTQDTLQGGIIVEWKKNWQEIPVCMANMEVLKGQNERQKRVNNTKFKINVIAHAVSTLCFKRSFLTHLYLKTFHEKQLSVASQSGFLSTW